jgi:uncharacterized protein
MERDLGDAKQRPGEKATISTAGRQRRTARYDEKLNAVLSASSALFAEKGFERATIRDVSHATGLSLAGLYYYFESKEELLFLIQFRTFESICKKLREIIDNESDPHTCLHRMINMHFEYFIRHMSDLKICSRELESLKGSFYQKVANKRKEYFDLTQSIFEKITDQSGGSSADPRLAALYLFGTLNWIYQWYKPGRYPNAKELAGQLSDIYLKGFPGIASKQPSQTRTRKQTPRVKQLKTMYAKEDDRLRGEGGWAKLPLFWFLLFLSYKCTRRCSYCYAFNQVGDNNVSEMDERTFSRLLEWIPEVWKANKIKVNAVGFLGGEPLLRTDRIKRVMDSIYDNTDGMQGFLYTNGDVIDSVNWDDLEDIQWISTNITDISIGELSRRMGVVSDRSNVIGQTIVATLDDFNMERILDVTRFGIDNGYRLRYYRDIYRALDEPYKKRLLRRYHEICDLLEDRIATGYDVHTTFLFDTLIPLWSDDSSPYPCGRRLATVFPDGSIGPCIRHHTMKTGTIFDADPMGKIYDRSFQYDFTRADIPDECRECDVRATCQGGCPYEKLVSTGTTSGKSVACDILKEVIPRLKHLDELKTARGEGTSAPSPQ